MKDFLRAMLGLLLLFAFAVFVLEISDGDKTETIAAPASTPRPTPTPYRPVGSSRLNPVSWAHLAPVNVNGARFNIAVTTIFRGQEALEGMLAANQFNGQPSDPDLEWMILGVIGEAIETDEEIGTVFGEPNDMHIYAAGRQMPQPLGAIPPAPELHGRYLPGAEIKGWAAFFVAKDDPKPLLFIQDGDISAAGTWFALWKE